VATNAVTYNQRFALFGFELECVTYSSARESSNENKMSDGGRDRHRSEWKCGSHLKKWSAQRSAVRSVAWLGLIGGAFLAF